MSIEDDARAWSLKLNRSANDLAFSAHKISAAFGDMSSKSMLSGNEPIPDPVKLLRRLSLLQSSIAQLQSESRDVAARRAQLVSSVTETLSENVISIQQLACRVVEDNTSAACDRKEWETMAIQVAESATRANECHGIGSAP